MNTLIRFSVYVLAVAVAALTVEIVAPNKVTAFLWPYFAGLATGLLLATHALLQMQSEVLRAATKVLADGAVQRKPAE